MWSLHCRKLWKDGLLISKESLQQMYSSSVLKFYDHSQDPATNWTLNSYVVSASVNNSNVSNLRDPVVVTLRHLKPKEVRNEK